MTLLISEKHLHIVKNIFKDIIPEGLCLQVYLFGSRACGTAKLTSDIDLAIYCKDGKKLPFPILLSLNGAFEDSALPVFVDIVDIVHADEALKKQIYEKGCIIWEK